MQVVEMYTNIVGRPHFPPMWALGYHQCRYGYDNDTKLQQVIDRTRAIGIPYVSEITPI